MLAVGPSVDGGRWPARAVVGEAVPISATVFREGHDAVAATAVLVRPDGTEHTRVRMSPVDPGTDRFLAQVVADATGDWTFRVEGWDDPYGTWEHDAVIKVAADVDTELMLIEGALLLEKAAADPAHTEADREHLTAAVAGLRDSERPAQARLAAGTSAAVHRALARNPFRRYVTASDDLPLRVQRELALYGSWYEFFPRSEGAVRDPATGAWTTGTLRTAAKRLDAIAEMGFDIAYLTPIHPIGTTNRKGRNNTLTTEPGDPGSPYAIGSPDGGHDAIAPELGTFDDFDAFVARARELGLEVALDIALQCSPDHPWVTEHPEWFTTRADGSIAYAENPPKKYQDIYPLNFDNDPEGIYAEVLRVFKVWIDHGVTAFRVDNPHTKPVEFWEWLIDEVGRRPPGRDLPGRGIHPAGDDAHPGEGRLPPVVHVLHLAQHEGRADLVPHGAVDRRRGRHGRQARHRRLHATELLADDPRHPHAHHAVRRTDGLRASRRPRCDLGSDLGHLHRLRAGRERRAARRRGADRQREVPVQAARLRRGA